MTPVEMRKAKSELHSLIITKVFAFSTDAKEDAELFQYVVELASREMLECVKELGENGNDQSSLLQQKGVDFNDNSSNADGNDSHHLRNK